MKEANDLRHRSPPVAVTLAERKDGPRGGGPPVQRLSRATQASGSGNGDGGLGWTR